MLEQSIKKKNDNVKIIVLICTKTIGIIEIFHTLQSLTSQFFAKTLLTFLQSNDPVPIFGPIELPKAPHWDAPTNNLYFVDVYKSLVHKYVPKTNTLKSATVGKYLFVFLC